jgi:hypothetical protein
LNFQGKCILAEDQGGGAVNVSVKCDEWFTIASHSGFFTQDGQANPILYYVGNDKCGWNSCDLNIVNQVDRFDATPITAQYGNIGIVLPFDLYPGDKLKICGQFWSPDATGADYANISLARFSCSELTTNGVAVVTPLGIDSGDYMNNTSSVCLSLVVEVNAFLPQCDTMIQVGINSVIQTTNPVKFTWTLSAETQIQ